MEQITLLTLFLAVAAMLHSSQSIYITKQTCTFEMTGDLCGWEEQVEQGEGDHGVVRASKSNLPGHPSMDFNPGTVNGSYYYYKRPDSYPNQVYILTYPSQKFIINMTFAFYMSGPQALRVVQSNVMGFDIVSNYTWTGNNTQKWEQATIQFGTPDLMYGISFESPTLSEEYGEAPLEGPLLLALDNIQLTFGLPCQFSVLNVPGNLLLSPQPSSLDIPLGQVTTVQFVASSTICPGGPFLYTIESNNVTALGPIFSLNVTSGKLTVDATGPHLIGKGVPLGILTVSVYVQDSDYLQNGDVFKKYTVLHFQQDPTIIVYSPKSINIDIGQEFTYLLNASSALNTTLHYNNITTSPSSLAVAVSLSGNILHGVFGYQHLVDVIKWNISPSITIPIVDSYNEILNHTIQLIILNQNVPVFNQQQYIFTHTENNKPTVLGYILVSDLNSQQCADLDVQINSTDTQVTGIFTLHYINVLTVLPNFCTFGLFVSVQLDYEDRSEYLFNVTARNTQGIITVAMVTVQVIGQNEYAPVITPSMINVHVSDYEPVNNLVIELDATDNDKGSDGKLSYAITLGNTQYFKLNKVSNGVVRVEIKHSPIEPNEYLLEVTVSDEGTPSLSDVSTITVTVIASGEINCNESVFGPPIITGAPDLITPAISSDITLQCNFTSNPLSYLVQWYKSLLKNPLSQQKLTSNNHYTLSDNTLTINSITSTDIGTYTCNITNQCGSIISDIHILYIIRYPIPPTDLSISQGPFQQYVSLLWTPPSTSISSPVSGYYVQLQEDGGNFQTYQTLSYYTSHAKKVSKTTVIGLKPGLNYTAVVFAYNQYFESGSNLVTFTTQTSAPKLAFFNSTTLLNNSLMIKWELEYTGGSHDIQMIITIQSNELQQRKRSITPESMSFDVGVNDNVLVTPALLYGRSYHVMGVVNSEYGSRKHNTIAFVGIQETLYCPFSLNSTCHWNLEYGVLSLAASAISPRPTTDASGSSSGVYVMSTTTVNLETLPLLSFPSINYICGFSFYYQVNNNIRLRLGSQHENESLIWASPIGDTTDWTYIEVPFGTLPISLSTKSLEFSMEVIGTPSVLSFAAVDDISLYFCLPCNYTSLNKDSIKLSFKNHSNIYIREDQVITIQTTVADCPNPILNYTILTVIPNQLVSNLHIPNSREGIVQVTDITNDIAEAGTVGYLKIHVELVGADYKHVGRSLGKSAVISFVISEKFENCSYLKFCDFENGPCDWELSDQSNTGIVSRLEAGNHILYSTPQSNDLIQIIGLQTINDSYCGISFIFQTQNTTLQVSVSGLGVVWSSIAAMDDTLSYANSSEIWKIASIYIDIQSTEMRPTREIMLEMVVNKVGVDNVKFVAIDNITLHPCVDCEAQECSCISCIQQCSTDPCQSGYYLSLEVNQCRPCPRGHYCTSWQTLPIPCSPGTYSDMTAASEVNKCLDCPKGTYSLQTGSTTCQTCPTGYNCSDPASIPLASSCEFLPTMTIPLASSCEFLPTMTTNSTTIETSVNVFIAAIVGGCIGALLMSIIIIIITCYYCYQRKKKINLRRKREHQMYKDNFYINTDRHHASKTDTVRTASTILSMKGKITEYGLNAYHNPAFESGSSDEDTEQSQTNVLAKDMKNVSVGRVVSRDPTIASLNSLDVKVDWPDTNPFVLSPSESNISALIELEDEDDHVWEALKRKKKQNKKESKF